MSEVRGPRRPVASARSAAGRRATFRRYWSAVPAIALVLLFVVTAGGRAPAADAPTPPTNGGLTLEVGSAEARYDTGRSVSLLLTVTNDTGAACRVTPDGDVAVHVSEVRRDDEPVTPSLGRAFFDDGLESRVRSSLRDVPTGTSTSFAVRTADLGDIPALVTVDALPGGDAIATHWPVTEPGRYSVTASYAVPAVPVPAGSAALCSGTTNLATVTFTVGEQRSAGVVTTGLGFLLALGLIALALWLTRGYRRGAATLALALVAGAGLLVANAPTAQAKVTLDSSTKNGSEPNDATAQKDFEDSVAGCFRLFRSGNDPLTLMPRVDAGSTPTVTVIEAPGASHTFDTERGPQGVGSSTIAWNPTSTAAYEDGVDRDPCAALYQELMHADGIAQGTTAAGLCGATGLAAEEARATLAENAFRDGRRYPRRTTYQGKPLPADLDACTATPRRTDRPRAICESAPAQDCAESTGDPHLRTFDQYRYDLQAVGELVLVQSTGADRPDLVIQSRQRAMPDSRTVSVNSALAARVGPDRIGLYFETDGWTVLVNGRPTTTSRGDLALPGGGRLSRQQSPVAYAVTDSLVLSWPDGSLAQLDPIGSYGFRLTARLATVRQGKVTGLLGNFDRDPSDDLRTRAGTVLTQPPSSDRLHRELTEGWRVGSGESLFDYASGSSTADFTDRSFPDRSVTTADLETGRRESATELCAAAGVRDPGVLTDCVLDVGSSGIAAFAVMAADAELALPVPTPPVGGGRTLAIDDAGSTRAFPGDLTVSLTSPGAVARFTFAGRAGQKVFLDVPSSTLPGGCGVLGLRGPGDDLLASGCIVGGSGFIDTTTLPSRGDYTLVVDPSGADTGTAALRLVTVRDEEQTGDADGPARDLRVSTPGAVSRLDFGVAANQKVFVTATSSMTSTCGFVSLRAADGSALSSGCVLDGGGYVDATLLPDSGVYSIVVDPAGALTGSVNVAVTTLTDQTEQIALGDMAHEALVAAPGAVSSFSFTGSAGQPISIAVTDSNFAEACGLLSLRGADGATRELGCVVEGSGSLEAVLPTDGRYAVVVDPAGAATGSLRLRVRG